MLTMGPQDALLTREAPPRSSAKAATWAVVTGAMASAIVLCVPYMAAPTTNLHTQAAPVTRVTLRTPAARPAAPLNAARTLQGLEPARRGTVAESQVPLSAGRPPLTRQPSMPAHHVAGMVLAFFGSMVAVLLRTKSWLSSTAAPDADLLAAATPEAGAHAYRRFVHRQRVQAEPWVMASMEGEVDDEGLGDIPLNYNSLRWVPLTDSDLRSEDREPEPGEEVMPIFPLQHAVHMPGSDHVLNIFEPRYCQMYNDIIMNGSRRFVVTLIQPTPEKGEEKLMGSRKADRSIAEVGAVFYIEELNKVDEETDGMIKYVCKHKVIGLKRLKKLINPKNLGDRRTYLKAVVEDFVDEDEGEDCLTDELAMSETFRNVVQLHKRLGEAEAVRFSDSMDVPGNMGTRGESGTFWQTANLWQVLLQERLGAFQTARVVAETAMVQEFLAQQGVDLDSLVMKADNGRVGIRLADLPEGLQEKYLRLQEEFQEESKPFVNLLIFFFQSLIQEASHQKRLQMMDEVMTKEVRRLQAKVALQSLFPGSVDD
mmetsp:Transcript_15944/g.28256  ORF Transcript_15944/g.28256 Transcript_15944/m.28256 type:complete len:540 (-) Transcript_15944:195-1814(-)